MASRMYRECVAEINYSLTTPQQNVALVKPIDADQIPNGYLKSLKLSVIGSETSFTGASFLIAASTNDNPAAADDWITTGAVGRGGGTIWLNLKRAVKSSVEEENRPDGVVYIHLITQGPTLVDPKNVQLSIECWGRFVDLVLQ